MSKAKEISKAVAHKILLEIIKHVKEVHKQTRWLDKTNFQTKRIESKTKVALLELFNSSYWYSYTYERKWRRIAELLRSCNGKSGTTEEISILTIIK